MTDWQKAQTTAQSTLDKYGFKEPLVDVYKIAQDNAIRIIPIIPEPGGREFSGFLDSNGERPVIYVNADESPARQNWTIAHELGHYFLKHESDHWGIAWRDQTYEEKDQYEQEADFFAACLLVPKGMLIKVMEKYKLKPEDYLLLAKMFGVSPQAMKNRIGFLRLK
jgi:Zn-dependent peptidase ImmA (M78 family)